ncbi:MAG: hypothetical protein ACLSB9_33570 [Hydrogeniiclostridium mannosilyticum]
MRRRFSAPHGFAVNGNLNKNKRVEFDVPYLLLAPRQPWEPCGQACSLQAVHWLPEGLADYNPRSASPSDVWANDSVYHNPPPKVVAKRATTPSFRSKCIAQSQQHKPPSLKREAACVRLVMALFPVSLAQAGTYPHGWYSLFKLQGERFFFPVRPIAQEKGRKASCFKKFF